MLKLDYTPIAADQRGRMDMEALEAELRKGDVGTVVVTLGTTAIGAVDPLDEILALRSTYGFRVHVDAAYGGYFRLIPDALDEPARRAFAVDRPGRLHRRSIRTSTACSPTAAAACSSATQRWAASTSTIRPTPISLPSNCTWARSAWSARAPEPRRWRLWATQQLLPPVPGGEFARGLARGRAAALKLDRRLREDQAGRFQPLAGGPGAGHCGLEDERRDAGTLLRAGAQDLCRLRPAGFASGSCTIAAGMVSACGWC